MEKYLWLALLTCMAHAPVWGIQANTPGAGDLAHEFSQAELKHDLFVLHQLGAQVGNNDAPRAWIGQHYSHLHHTNAALIREAIERRNKLSATAASDLATLATKVATIE